MNTDPIVIVAAKRTAMGGLLGIFKNMAAWQLGAVPMQACLEEAALKPSDIDSVIMGCVLSAGQGQAPARQAALAAKLPDSIPATTINKMCGSGMQAVILAHDQILAGSYSIALAGGMESMSNAPYLLLKARNGFRLGHGELKDHMFLDGLEDAYDRGKLMGVFAEETAKEYGFSRTQQDEFAISSLTNAKDAIEKGYFRHEICSVSIQEKDGTKAFDIDEQPPAAKIEKISTLKPAFAKDGTVTAANSSSISDGAATLIIMRKSEAERRKLKILAKIVAHASHSHEPKWFTTAPVGAINKVLQSAGWSQHEVDLYEINEAFAVVTMAAIKDLNLDPNQVNIHGGACALGHPIGASGARIITTLIHALERTNKQRGIASLCIGGGEAVAIAIERI